VTRLPFGYKILPLSIIRIVLFVPSHHSNTQCRSWEVQSYHTFTHLHIILPKYLEHHITQSRHTLLHTLLLYHTHHNHTKEALASHHPSKTTQDQHSAATKHFKQSYHASALNTSHHTTSTPQNAQWQTPSASQTTLPTHAMSLHHHPNPQQQQSQH
jgi:hypothetical protein